MKPEETKLEQRRADAPVHTKPKHKGNDVSFNYSGNIGSSASDAAGYGGAYATMTISLSHSEPIEVAKARNMLEAKALELREQFRKDGEDTK